MSSNLEVVESSQPIPTEEEDLVVCEICLSGTVYEGNEILFCDKCNVAVHQGCYSVGEIPEGSWFCYVCAAGQDPASLQCEVCPYTGGAYKPVYKTDKWAHSLCCQWIPEVYIVVDPTSKAPPSLNLLHLDKKRFKLRCNLCNINRGACVQCCYGRCVSASHPWCIVKTPQGCTKRVVIDPEGSTIWETFCKAHASAVTEPLKPKPKAKMQVPLVVDEPQFNSLVNLSSSKKDSKSRLSDFGSYDNYIPQPTAQGRALSMAHAKNFMAARLLTTSTSSTSKESPRPSDRGSAEDLDGGDADGDESDEDLRGQGRAGKTVGRKGTKAPSGSSSSKSLQQDGLPSGKSDVKGATTTFPILNMLEWPGISEGEAMDLDHFWNVISGYYPEDHPTEWLEFMLADLHKPIVPLAVQSVLATAVENSAEVVRTAPRNRSRNQIAAAEPATVHVNVEKDALWDIPPLGNTKCTNRVELAETAEELMNAFNGERERSAVLDEDKRTTMIMALSERLPLLKGAVSKDSNACPESPYYFRIEEGEAETKSNSNCDSSVDSKCMPAKPTEGCSLLLSENEFYTKPTPGGHASSIGSSGSHRAVVEDIDYVDAQNCATVRAVFDGNRRFACDFKVFLPDPSLPTSKQVLPALPPATNSRLGRKWHAVGLSAPDVVESAKWAHENLIPPGEFSEEEIIQSLSLREDGYEKISISLNSMEPVAEANEVHLTDRVIIPRDQDNSLCRAIRTDAHVYAVLCEALQQRIKALMEKFPLKEMSGSLCTKKVEWDAIDQLYTRQQVWKQVCSGLHRGIRDQRPDFNKTEEEAMPASWQLEVQGRPKALEEEDEPEPHEDAVCMCCFDGTSSDGNKILFCDGCNAAVHQICYGVPQIPDGDFFCDRCQYVQLLANDSPYQFDYYHAKTAVMCCLCPLQHGGLKPTTDGRWVHLCCALWTPETIIEDMVEMSPINLTKVPVQFPDTEAPVTTSWGRTVKPVQEDQGSTLYFKNCTISPISDACMYCNLRGGLVKQCCAEEGCRKTFHPICAWFDGLYMSTEIEDPTFKGLSRDGLYPSGISFKFLCDLHSTSDAARPENDVTVRGEQRLLRCKYRIKEDDLEQIPGQNKRKRKKPRKPSKAVGRGAGAGGANLKELNTDVYDCRFCAACLDPISPDVFLCGYVSTDRPAWEEEEEIAQLEISSPSVSKSVFSPAPQQLPGGDAGFTPSRLAATATSPSAHEVGSSETNETSAVVTHLSVEVTAAESADHEPKPSLPPMVTEVALLPDTTYAEVPRTLETDNCDYFSLAHIGESPGAATAPSNALPPAPDTQLELTCVPEPLLGMQPDHAELVAAEPTVALDAIANPIHQPIPYILNIFPTDSTPSMATVPPADVTPSAVETNTTDVIQLTQTNPAAIELKCEIDVPSNALMCSVCKLFVHKACVVGFQPEQGGEWQCDTCLLRLLSTGDEPPSISCTLCPRKGGYFKRTTDFRWAHLYCANSAPGQIRITQDGKVDIRALPKDNRKEKCCICNRKSGVCVQCCHVGCTTQFHALCSARSGKGCIRTRMGEKNAYCFAHLPEGLERLPSGHWVDGYEIERLRYGLERARLILDVLVRREKHKKMLCKAETELLSIKFHKTLDKAKKRKTKSGDDDVDLSDMSLYESESDYYSDDEADKLMPGIADEFIPFGEAANILNRSSDMVLPTSMGEELISGSWIKRKEARLPKRLAMNFSGIEIDRKDVQRESTQRGFLKHFQNLIAKNSNAMRPATQIFSSTAEEAEFGRSVAPKLKKHMAMEMNDFIVAMKCAPWLGLGNDRKAGISSAKKMPGKFGTAKKGYAFVYEDEQIEDNASNSDASVHERGGGRSIKVDGRARSMSAVSNVSSTDGKKGRGRPRKCEHIQEQPQVVATADKKKGTKAVVGVELIEGVLSPGRRRGRSAVEVEQTTVNEVSPVRKKSKKQLQMEADAAAEELERQASAKRKGKVSSIDPSAATGKLTSFFPKLTKLEQIAAAAAAVPPLKNKGSKRFAEGEPEPQVPEVIDSRTKRQRLRDEEILASKEITSPQVPLTNIPILMPSKYSKEDQRKYSKSNLYLLERRMKDILNELDEVEVPGFTEKDLKPSNKNSKSKKILENTSLAADDVEMRKLVEDFEDVPYDAIPEYDSLVQRVVTINSMKATLADHQYSSMSEFSNDFYTLLNNARSITPAGTVTWKDAEMLAELFENFKENTLTDPACAKARAPGHEIISSKTGGPVVGASAQNNVVNARTGKQKWICACCKNQFTVINWPTDFNISTPFVALSSPAQNCAWAIEKIAANGGKKFQLPDDYAVNTHDSKERRERKVATFKEQWAQALQITTLRWSWLCAQCIAELGAALIGVEVNVWWHDDMGGYRGTIDAFDEVSQCHRVLYEDNEWEFVNLAIEPVMFGSENDFVLPSSQQGRGKKKK